MFLVKACKSLTTLVMDNMLTHTLITEFSQGKKTAS